MTIQTEHRADPISRVQWLPASSLRANPWNPNRVHKPELTLLATSILLTGWVQPVLATEAGLIIDGFHRWRIAQDVPEVVERYDGELPVAMLDLDRESAMLLTVRINRAKGTHGSVHMATLVRELIAAGVPKERIMAEMGATAAEVDLLSQPDVFKARGSAGHAYSAAWYPVEDGRTAEQSRGTAEPDIPAAVGDDEEE